MSYLPYEHWNGFDNYFKKQVPAQCRMDERYIRRQVDPYLEVIR